MDPIEVKIGINTADAIESMWAFVEATKEGIEKAYTGAVDTAERKLGELNRKQEQHHEIIGKNQVKLAEWHQQMQSASEIEQKSIQQQIDALTKLNQAHIQGLHTIEQQKIRIEEKGLIALGATDAEINALKKANTQQLINIGAMQDQVRAYSAVKDASQQQIAAAVAGIHEVVNAQRVHQQTIELDKAKLSELMQKRQEASGADAKAIDQQITSLKKSIGNQEEQIRMLDLKRVKLEENLAIITATSEAEAKAAQDQSAASQAEIQSLNDVVRAQNAVTGSVEKSTSSVANLLTQFGGLVGVTSIVSGLALAFHSADEQVEKMRQEVERTMEAADRLAGRQGDAFARSQKAMAELGITDPAQKQAMLTALNSTIPAAQTLTPDTVVDTAQSMGWALKAAGITDPSSARFQDIVGNAAQGVYQGIDGKTVANVFANMSRENPNVTGAQLNQQLGSLSSIAGSPSLVNNMEGVVEDQRTSYGVLGMGESDIQKMFASAGGNPNIKPEQRAATIQGYLRGLDRFVGKTPEQYLKLYEAMTGVTDGRQGHRLEEMAKHGSSPAEILNAAKGMKQTQSFPELDSLFDAGTSGKEIDMRQIAAVLAKLDPHRQEQIMTAGGGPRAMKNAFGIGDWSGANLPSGGAFPIPSSSAEINSSQSAVATFDATNRESINPEATAFQKAMDQEKDVLNKHPEYLPQVTRSYNESSGVGQVWDKYVHHVLGGVPTNNQVAASNTMARLFLKDAAKLRDMKSGKVKGTQADMDALQERLSSESMWIAGDNGNINNIAGGNFASMPDMNDEDAVRKWMSGNIDYGRNTQSVGEQTWYNAQTLGGYLKGGDTPTPLINPVLNPLPSGKAAPVQGPPAPSKPTTQPVSINYHIRQTNYGYGADALSGGATPSNDYG